MNDHTQQTISIVHNTLPNRIRVKLPLIKHKQVFADLFRHDLLKNTEAKGIYYVEPNVVTGTVLIKYHPALHNEQEVLQLVSETSNKVRDGIIEITHKHKHPKLGRMPPGAFFTRELLVSIAGNVIAGILLTLVIAG
jgi:hypothetical protein